MIDQSQPISDHDYRVIYEQLVRLNYEQFRPPIVEIHVSSARLHFDGVKLFGFPVRRRGDLALNEGCIIVDCREVVAFYFETPR